MRKILPMTIVLLLPAIVAAIPLQQVYESAPAREGYDRYLELETGVVYTGGLLIGPTWDNELVEFTDLALGLDVKIVGNGAILDLQGERICISFCGNRLDVEDCIVTGGAIRFRGDNVPDEDRTPEGSVRHCTFWRTDGYGVRLEGCASGIVVERNIVVDAIENGREFSVWNSISEDFIPTGMNVAMSVQIGSYGFPLVRDNWSFHTDPTRNADLLNHFGFL